MVNERYPRSRRDGSRRTSHGDTHQTKSPSESGVNSFDHEATSATAAHRTSRRLNGQCKIEPSVCEPQSDGHGVGRSRRITRRNDKDNLNGNDAAATTKSMPDPIQADTSPEQDDKSDRTESRRSTRKSHGQDTRNGVDVKLTSASSSSSRRETRHSLRTAHVDNDEEEHSDHHEEQRRSSRRRRLPHRLYDEVDVTPFRLSRRRKDADSPAVAEEEAENACDDDLENMDMYTRVKRTRRKVKRDMYGMPLVEEEEKTTEDEEETENDDEEGEEEEEDDEEAESEEATTGQYNLRRNKPRTKLYEATIEKKKKYFKDTPPKRRYQERSGEIKFKSPAHRLRKRKRACHRTSSTSSSGSESEDERRFARRKNKSMAKARQRCLPMNLSQNDLTHTMKDRQKIGASLADIDPMSLDRSITFDSVGGLTEHVQALKEMIVFPLLYPEVFERFKIAPPRGVLFHGPPGTGKTLVARALANECSTGEKRVAFFMRKGADCLSKWVGESERQLRLLFDQAYQVRPSIIFFDEIDGLAPVRSSRQDQIHSSIVSTLLALMDGLDSRGEVVVIGATNRIDSIDPALRRPGRFDREFLFNLPPVEARADILRIHTKEWNPKLLDKFIHEVASKCNGYCGADMKALCTEAALHALRRRYPQIYSSSDKLQLDVTSIDISAGDFHYAMSKIVPAGQRAVLTPSRPLSVVVKPLLHQQLDALVHQLSATFPFVAQSQTTAAGQSSLTATLLEAVDDDSQQACVTECPKSKRRSKQGPEAGPFLDFSVAAYSTPIVSRPRLLLHGDPAHGHSTHLAPALLHCMEKMPVHLLDIPTLYANSARTPEESCSQVFREARRSTPSVIYIPHIHKWWRVLSDTMQATFLMMLNDVDPLMPILLLATSDYSARVLPPELRELFAAHSTEMYEVERPEEAEIRSFFEDLILRQTCVPPATRKQAARNLLEVLPKVPVSTQPTQLTEVEETALWHEEENILRELRLFLREMLNKLARDRKFNIFSKPVDDEEVPDYYEIIKMPMDLSTMMSKIDLHQYQACKEFLFDIDLICANALEYNPATSVAGKAIRHRACALKDMAHALVEAELDEDFEKKCFGILESRRNRGKSPSKSAPKYYHTKPLVAQSGGNGVTSASMPSRYSRRVRHEEAEELAMEHNPSPRKGLSLQSNRVSHDITQDDLNTPAKKRRKKSRWSRGCITRKRYRRNEQGDEDLESEEEEEDSKQADPDETAAEVNGDQSESVSPTDIQLPVGDVDQAKLNLSGRLDACSNSNTEEINTEHMSNSLTTEPIEHALNGDSNLSSITSNDSTSNGPVTENIASNETTEHSNTDNLVSTEATTTESQLLPQTQESIEAVQAEESASQTEMEVDADQSKELASSEPVTSPVIHEKVVELEPQSPQPQPKKRMTRSMTNDVHMLKCVAILDEPEPALIIDTAQLPTLLEKAVIIGSRANVTQLEKLYSLLAQKIYHHRSSYDRKALLQDLDEVLENFADCQ